MNKLPEEFSKRMLALMGDEFHDFAYSCSSGDRKNALRVTELKTNVNRFFEQAPFQMEPVQWLKNGFFYDYKERISGHPFYKAGLFYITEASAMTPADRLPVEPGDKVLDLCAAPGGKAYALAGKLGGTGLLVANEVNPARAKALLSNLEVLGARNILITNEQPCRLAEKFSGYFDKILVDAPCSGEGMFRRNPDAVRQWSEDKVRSLAALQKSILKSAVSMLKPGGMVMYSTCTFSPEENEQNVSWLLNECPELEIREIEPYEGFDPGRKAWAGGDERVEKAFRIWPHRMEGEGQFMALFQKTIETKEQDLSSPAGTAELKNNVTLHRKGRSSKKQARAKEYGKNGLSRDEERIFGDFASHMKLDMEGAHFERRKTSGGISLVGDELPDTEGLRTIRRGLYLGEFKKERFEPSQSLAFALSADTFDNVCELKNDPDAYERYMRGETISPKGPETENKDDKNRRTAKNGWILVTYEGFSLGFGKKNGGMIKNKLLYSRRSE